MMLKSKQYTNKNSNPTQTESDNIMSILSFEPGSVGGAMNSLANPVTPLLFSDIFLN
jgi:hypothetical protein